MRSLTMLVLGLSLTGCATPLTYGTQAATAGCNQQQTCNLETFESVFDDFDDCVATFEPVLGGSCYLDHCDTFDASAGNACLAEIRGLSCSEEVDFQSGTCASVWSDCSALELGACLLSNAFGQN